MIHACLFQKGIGNQTVAATLFLGLATDFRPTPNEIKSRLHLRNAYQSIAQKHILSLS
jgi:hypothetical protein